jgi:membrane associated rhomboid family serine protease
MGFNDRDYSRSRTSGGFGSFNALSVTTWLIAINVAVFVLDGLLTRMADPDSPRSFHPLTQFGYFSLTTAIQHFQLWRILTYQFLHQNITHILFNMLGLYFFGPIVESQLGARRYLGFYLSCGIAGAIMYVILWSTGILIAHPDTPMVGASAAIIGVLLAAAHLAPGMTITLWFPPIPVTLRTLAWFFLAVAAYTILVSGVIAGGEAAHLGGGLWGYLLIRNDHWLNILTPGRPRLRRRRRVAFRDWTRDMNH